MFVPVGSLVGAQRRQMEPHRFLEVGGCALPSDANQPFLYDLSAKISRLFFGFIDSYRGC
jgi:hypothetical protein